MVMKKTSWHLFIQIFLLCITTAHLIAQNEETLIDSYSAGNDLFHTIFDNSDSLDTIPIKSIVHPKDFRTQPIKDFTFILYMAADNDLQRYAVRNIKQMSTIGSTDSINIVAHLDIRANNKKVCSHFYVEKNNILEFNQGITKLDSGDPQSLITFIKWTVENFPARHYMLDFWDHGTGIVDPTGNRIIRATDLFVFNPDTRKLELDRSIDFLELILNSDQNQYGHIPNSDQNEYSHLPMRGICWDDSTGHYLTNQKLAYALATIKEEALHGQKFDIIGFDACLMSMLEIADILKDYAHILVASQEVELGTGWNYQNILAPFAQGTLEPLSLAKHIVNAYEKIYSPHTNDYTLSAINLDQVNNLNNNINTIADLLLTCLRLQKNMSVKKALNASRSRRACTHFDTPQYIDLHHFYRNLQANLKSFSFNNEKEGARLIQTLSLKLEEGKAIIENIVLANVAGINLSQAKGISIYFPEQKIHSSYTMTSFAKNNRWAQFLTQTVPIVM
jgi:hypothetical protein